MASLKAGLGLSWQRLAAEMGYSIATLRAWHAGGRCSAEGRPVLEKFVKRARAELDGDDAGDAVSDQSVISLVEKAADLSDYDDKYLATLYRDVAHRMVRSLALIPDASIRRMDPRVRMMISAQALEKAQVLSGGPTEIVGHRHRLEIDEAALKLLAECRRRGIIEGEFTEVGDG